MVTIAAVDPIVRRTPRGAWNASQSLHRQQERLGRMRRMIPILLQQQRQNASVTETPSHFGQEMALYGQSHFWQVASLLIVAEYEKSPFAAFDQNNDEREVNDRQQDDNDEPAQFAHNLPPSRILRAVIANPQCPSSWQEYAIFVYHAHLMDPVNENDGQIPLHLAVTTAPTLVADLIWACPQSSHVRNANGDLALTLAYQKLSWSQGLGALVQANPRSLAELPGYDDAVLWPQILARVAASAVPGDLYSLIRACPQPFASCVSSSG
uniref:Uncharacterized protein n=1 Tax=Entomoneis paludosa TaxID=265537 RepID=A0A7S2YMF3_9STRA|mmetsp:Transcript_38694/g.80372  ORF Transcript_38694/g.80372 Transcript_38694/m.80372 type:complete len:267 (+) Transcript_38694:265-1065(+)